MKNLHEKSPCCGVKIWRLNKKRRQCSKCKKTWRVWKKQRGRKAKRYNFEPLFKYLNFENGSMSCQARKKGLAYATIHTRMKQIVEKYNKVTPWPTVPQGDLIAVVDAMIEYINSVPHVVYFILLRSVSSSKAIITPPLIVTGSGEGLYGWQQAFDAIPANVKIHIQAVVCDGVHAVFRISQNEGWILQRCHFHLRARIVHYCSPRRFGKRPQFAKEILRLTNIILITRNEKELICAIKKLSLLKSKITTRSFNTVISGFIRNYENYRSYQHYPELNLPTTSNSIENFIGQIRNLQRRARGFRSLKSLNMWIEAFCKYTKKVTCNPKNHIPN